MSEAQKGDFRPSAPPTYGEYARAIVEGALADIESQLRVADAYAL
ncbi:MAG TPA: hypothetical protein VHA09_01420 [Nitrososphaera sp.]|nr:hypothetical protein [Nitrososphaera sp.]